jgi:lipopolysaccharide heptosyltransferase I
MIVKLSSIGDVVHTLPAVAALRRSFPQANIIWAVGARASDIPRHCPAVDKVIEVPGRPPGERASTSPFAGLRDGMAEVRSERADIVIDFQGLLKSGLVAFASGAGRRIGFAPPDLRERSSAVFLTDQVPTQHINHVIDKNLALSAAAVALLGNGSTGNACKLSISDVGTEKDAMASESRAAAHYSFPLTVPREDEQYVESLVGRSDRRFAIINPGGGWPTKLWQASRYGQIADWLRTEHQLDSLVTYGPGEESLADQVAAGSRLGAARPAPSSLLQFVALARRAALFVGGDTGPLHLAAACGTPIVGLYGPTSPQRNGPFDSSDVSLGRDLWCRSECHRRSCWHWDCMEIPVSEVQQAVSRRLQSG